MVSEVPINSVPVTMRLVGMVRKSDILREVTVLFTMDMYLLAVVHTDILVTTIGTKTGVCYRESTRNRRL